MSQPVVAAQALSHISLKVTDIARSQAWYGAVLGYDVFLDGLAPTPDRSRHCIGLIGATGMALELLQVPGAGVAPRPNTLGLVGISLTVADAAESLAALQAGGHAQGSRVITADGWKVVFFTDPDGNIIELVQQPNGAPTVGALADQLRGRA